MAEDTKTSGIVAAPVAPVAVNANASAQTAPKANVTADKPQAERVYGVELAGVPETPASTATAAVFGPAIPSTDPYTTVSSPNKDTSSEAPLPKFLGGDA